jgi:uncharacterized protein YqeY
MYTAVVRSRGPARLIDTIKRAFQSRPNGAGISHQAISRSSGVIPVALPRGLIQDAHRVCANHRHPGRVAVEPNPSGGVAMARPPRVDRAHRSEYTPTDMEADVGILETVSDQMKDAMRAKDAPRTLGLRNIRAAFLVAMKEDGASTLSDARCVEVLRKLAKQRKESIEAYQAASRPDLADPEIAELAIIDALIPAGPDRATILGWIDEAIAATGASGARDVNKVLGAVMKAHKGEADGAVVRALAVERLDG